MFFKVLSLVHFCSENSETSRLNTITINTKYMDILNYKNILIIIITLSHSYSILGPFGQEIYVLEI